LSFRRTLQARLIAEEKARQLKPQTRHHAAARSARAEREDWIITSSARFSAVM
jgi:hypothetical protein